MFLLSKLFYIFARPSNFLFLLLLLGAALTWGRNGRVRRLGRGLLTVVALFALALLVLPISNYALRPLEDRFPAPATLPEKIDGIIVLGGEVEPTLTAARGQVTLTSGGNRVTEAMMLARRYPEARVLFAGGSGSIVQTQMKEADVAKRYFVEMGLDPARLILENRSRNTHENAVFSYRIAAPKPGQHWLLVTSAWHMPRAVGTFRALGWSVIPYPVGYETSAKAPMQNLLNFAQSLTLLDRAIKEWIGLAAYRLLGWSDSLFPAPQQSP